jgi:hypothetical protein
MGRISTPVRTAQRRRPPRCPASRDSGFEAALWHRLYRRAAPWPWDRGATLPRPPHPAPRTVTIAKRPSRWGGTEIGIWSYGNRVKPSMVFIEKGNFLLRLFPCLLVPPELQ